MRVAIISDVHANLEALTAVIKDIETSRAEKVFFLGDAVGYGVDPNQCIALIDSLCEIKLLGNHDYVALGLDDPRHFNTVARESILWTQDKLQPSSEKILTGFEMQATFLDHFLVHATPENPRAWNYILTTEDAAGNFPFFSQNYCFVGHSHIPGVFCLNPDGNVDFMDTSFAESQPECRYIINVGSVGQPRDGNPAACYLLADTRERQFEFRRVPYEIETAQEKMKQARLPDYLIHRLASGR
jgi:diadenosine tetraphosphatase ApaH/serine/threonine PP2A family protein phosphatase